MNDEINGNGESGITKTNTATSNGLVLKNSLKINRSSSVQPNVLLRTPVFTPVGRKTKSLYTELDLSSQLRDLDICQREGYQKVSLRGAKLNTEVDFKTWTGIVYAFSLMGFTSNKITMGFTEFAGYCGYPSRRFDSKLRKQIANSLGRIKSQTLSLYSDKVVDGLHTGLLLSAKFEESKDLITLQADENLWDLYLLDHQVLVNLNILNSLPRAEVAQCLYLYFVALPHRPHPISFTRLRARLQLESELKECNRLIKNAIKKLTDVGFISGSIVKKPDDTYYIIHSRNKNLKTERDDV